MEKSHKCVKGVSYEMIHAVSVHLKAQKRVRLNYTMLDACVGSKAVKKSNAVIMIKPRKVVL